MKNVFLFLATIVSVAHLAACSAKIEGKSSGGPGDDVPPPPDFSHKVKGPSLEGKWFSDCTLDGTNSFKLNYNISGQTVEIKKATYSDTTCQTNGSSTVNKGRFRFAQDFGNNFYELEYKLEMTGGTFTQYENVKMIGNKLYVTQFNRSGFVGMSNTASPQPPTPTPTPPPAEKDPSEVSGGIVYNWSSAKYVYCEVQGVDYMLDFNGVDLSTTKQGKIKMAGRACRSKKAFDWYEIDFNITGTSEKDFYMTLGTRSSVKANGSGLYYSWANFGGNTGVCYFMMNKGYKGYESQFCRY